MSMKHADQLFLKALLEELEERNEVEALHLMHNIIDEARQEPTERERLHAWCVMEGRDDRAVTTELRDICGSHGDYWRDLSFSNSVDAIDAAALAAATDLLTGRTFEDRLFPAQEWDTGWTLSLQADMAGYQCAPKERLAHLEYYDAVEAVIYGPDGMLVDPTALDLPEDVVAKFTELEPGSGPAIGCKLTWEDVKAVRTALNMAGMNPNAGVPRGSIGWHGADLWHGTDKEA
ncbi:MAG: hypothetical protein ABJN42_12965, partial [Roseibium sp.]|uniref:hypothetical protein n=1 Tax=Roseibium sp. TaxID=1936156 RepID=UPI00329944FC